MQACERRRGFANSFIAAFSLAGEIQELEAL
jgi:hypothetical protein